MIKIINDLLNVIYAINNFLKNPYIYIPAIIVAMIWIIQEHEKLK